MDNYISDNEFEENDSGSEDDMFLHFAVQIAFPNIQKTIRERPDHFSIWSDSEFLHRFRLSKNTVRFIIEMIEDKITSPTIRNNAMTANEKVFITLRYYATGSFVANVGDFGGAHESTAGKIIRTVTEALASLRPDFIHMPEDETEMQNVRQAFFNIAKFPSCIGALDCTHIKIRSPGGRNAEIFRNRKHYFSINVQTICDANLKIQDIVARWPGCSHDTNIFKNSYIRQQFESGKFGDNVLVADSGYPSEKYLMTPLLNPETACEHLFNESQIATRNPVERSYGVWKRRFPVLSVGMNIRLSTVLNVIVATAVLHNIALRCGDAVPRTTIELENLIKIQELELVPNIEGGNRSPHRTCHLNYFNTLL